MPLRNDVYTTHRVQVVVDPFGGFGQRCPVEELERTDRSIYLSSGLKSNPELPG